MAACDRSHAPLLWAMLFVLALVMRALPASAAAAPSSVGDWITANGRSVVALEQCGATLCGRIVGIDRAPGDPMPTDWHGRSQCGLTIMTDETPTPDGAWQGKITDPRDGSTYQTRLWLDAGGRLHLRGYIGIPLLGQTQIWHRFTGHLTAECGLGYQDWRGPSGRRASPQL
ncbi:MAG: DUF2147 domain-containing protein [Pseudomonadota bacterium]|nr:DUF2147 domain-containing protein [Pseudomonadota bacterium]